MSPVDVVREDHEVSSEGYRLWARIVRPAGPRSRTVTLFVHGLTFPSVADYDLPVCGASLCEYLALNGHTCCIFDLRGYGQSDKPPYGESVGMAERARDLLSVWQWLKSTQDMHMVSLAGLSSGCNTIAECLRICHEVPERVLMVAPCYLLNPAMRHCLRRARSIRALLTCVGRPRAVYARLSTRLLRNRLYTGEEELMDRQTFERFLSVSIELTNPGRTWLCAPVLRYPEVRGISRLWQPIFDASALTAPLLVIRGDGDEFCCARSAEALLADAGSVGSRLVTLPDRKHDIHLYKRHDDFFEEVHRFLAGS